MKRFVSIRTANHWQSCVTIARFVLLKQELWLRQSVKVNRRKRSWFTFRIACRESEMQRERERVCPASPDVEYIKIYSPSHHRERITLLLVLLAACTCTDFDCAHWCSKAVQAPDWAHSHTDGFKDVFIPARSRLLMPFSLFSSRPSLKVPLLSTDVQQGTQSCRHIPLCLAHSGERMCNVAGFTCTAGG